MLLDKVGRMRRSSSLKHRIQSRFCLANSLWTAHNDGPRSLHGSIQQSCLRHVAQLKSKLLCPNCLDGIAGEKQLAKVPFAVFVDKHAADECRQQPTPTFRK